jgi:esterase
MLNLVTYDGPDNVPLLIVHGLFGSARNWGVIAKKLAVTRPVIAVDMRNHGQSPWHDTHSYLDMAADLAAIMDRPMDVLGHSMGGKAAMVLALQSPALVRRLIVADIAPVTYAHTQQGPIDAMRKVDLDQTTSRADAKAQMVEVDPQVADFLLQSLDLSARRWLLNLDVLARDMPLITGFPQVTGVYDGPALFVSGGLSDYVTPAHHAPVKALFPAAEFVEIADAGHWLHAQKPNELIAAISAFLDA